MSRSEQTQPQTEQTEQTQPQFVMADNGSICMSTEVESINAKIAVERKKQAETEKLKE